MTTGLHRFGLVQQSVPQHAPAGVCGGVAGLVDVPQWPTTVNGMPAAPLGLTANLSSSCVAVDPWLDATTLSWPTGVEPMQPQHTMTL